MGVFWLLIAVGAIAGTANALTTHNPEERYFNGQDGRRLELLALQEKIGQKISELRYATTESKVRNAISAINVAVSAAERTLGEDLSGVRSEARAAYQDEAVDWMIDRADACVKRGDQWKAVSFLESGKEFCRNGSRAEKLDQQINAIISKQEDFA